MRYNTYSDSLKERFGEKVYKIPVQLPVTCPNRDGNCGSGGCIFCGEVGTGFENLSADLSIASQLKQNIYYIGQKYNANKFIAYFNNYSNTYMTPEMLKNILREASLENVVGFCISTRPDCISKKHLDAIEEVLSESMELHEKTYEVTIELGLQSINYHTLEKLNRGHGLAVFIDAVLKIKSRGFRVCTHLIGNLPWDNKLDIEEAARLLTVLSVDEVKIHTLYVLKNTVLGTLYEAGEIELGTPEMYVDNVVAFIRLTSPQTVFQRFAGRAPEEETLFCNWGMSWWKIKDMIDHALEIGDFNQGDACDYLDGPAVRRFL